MSTQLIATLVIAALALATIAADWGRRRPAFYLLKPLTTALLIALLASSAQPAYYLPAMLVAFGFCLVGDVALMAHGSRAFIAGLSAFLIAHLVIASLFYNTTPGLQLTPGVGLLAAVALAYGGYVIAKAGKLAPAVAVYLAALFAMAALALMRDAVLATAASRLSLIGALLFMVSDGVLAWRKFVRSFALGQAATLVTYYAALWCFACGG